MAVLKNSRHEAFARAIVTATAVALPMVRPATGRKALSLMPMQADC
jgi:hypothetical protein